MTSDSTRRGRRTRRTRADASRALLTAIFTLTCTSAVIFILSALIGVFVAFDKAAALNQFALIIAGLFVAWATVWLNDATRDEGAVALISIGSGWLAALLGGYYLLTHDWARAQTVKFAPIQQVGLLIQRLRPAMGMTDAVNSNVAAAAIIVLIGLGLGGAAWLWWRSRRLAWLTGMALGLAASVLVLTASRGAWLGLGTGLLTAGYLWWRTGSGRENRLRFGGDSALALLLLALVGSFLITLISPDIAGPLGRLTVGGSALSRANLWRDTLPLIQDYLFSGSGLAGTAEIYSAYIFLLHVNFLTHAHNLYLQIAVAQGIPGLIGFLGMIVAATGALLLTLIYGNRDQRRLATGGLAALTALLVHGLMDGGPYVSRAIPIMFLPFGVAWGLAASLQSSLPHPQRHTRAGRRKRTRARVIGGLTPVALILLLFILPGARAAFQANLGAISQTNAELSAYEWPTWPVQDELRRTQAVDLNPAIRRYSTALRYNSSNVTAHRRIGQIAISTGSLDLARTHLEAAYNQTPAQRPTRQMLGEVDAVQGDPVAAAQLWRSVTTASGQLDVRRWWWQHVGTAEQQVWMDAAIEAASE